MKFECDEPKVTVIVAVYNGAKTLSACLDSICRQTYRNKELVIMDGGSSDGTVGILQENSGRISYWESSPDRGIYHAWNKALSHASGEWIYFLGADDIFHDDDVLEKFSAKMAGLESPPLVAYGKIEYCKNSTRTVMGRAWNEIENKMKSGMCMPHQGVFHHRRLFQLCGSFDEKYQIAGDYHLLLKSLRIESPFFLGDLVVADQYAGGKSSVRELRWKVLQEFRSAQRSEGIPLTFGWVVAYTKAMLWRWVL